MEEVKKRQLRSIVVLAFFKDAAVNRFQAIAHIGQGAAHDHAHRVIEIARFHLVDDVNALKFT